MPQMAGAFITRFVATNLVRLGLSKAFAVAAANVAGFIVTNGLVIGASVIVNAVFAPKQSMPDGRIPQRQATAPRKSGFGRNRGSGAYLNYAVDGGDSIDVLAIHDGRIAGIDQYLLHDDYVTLETGRLGAGHVVGDASTHQYYEAIYFDTRLGTATQTAFQRSVGRLSSSVWSSSHRMLGVAGVELLCLGPKQERLPKVYPLGLPRPSVIYRAQYCYDPTDAAQDVDDWTTWTPGSRNPILQLITHLINPRDPDPAEPDRCLGEGKSFAETIEPQLAAWTQAIADCDAAIAKKGGGTEPAYQCDFEYFVGEDPADTRARILASCDGWMAEAGDGALTVKVGKYRAPTVTLSNDWLVDYEIVAGVEAEKRKNVLIGFWTDPAQKFTRVEGERWYDAAHIALVGKAEFQPAEFTQVQSHGQLRRLLKRLMAKMAAPRRGVLRCDLRALDVVGERWVALPDDFPIAALQGAVIEIDDLNIDLGADRVEIPFIQADPDVDDWDPDSEEGTAPPAPSEVAVQPVPVIDVGDIAITVTTEPVFGGNRAAVATLVFDAPVNTFDLGAGGMVDEPRVELGWVVRWRPSSGGEWTEEIYGGEVVTGNQEDGYLVTLKTPGLPRQEIHVQLAAIGGNGGRGVFSDSVTVDVKSATAPALAAATGVTAVASMEEGDAGARRPVLTVGFDAITDPQAQLVIIAVKDEGAGEATYSQIDAVEPRQGGKVVWNVPLGATVDVGVQVWAQWREPSAWVTVSSVDIPGEVGASTIGGEAVAGVLFDVNQALTDSAAAVDGLAQEIVDRLAGDATLGGAVDEANDRLDTARADIDAERARLTSTVAQMLAGFTGVIAEQELRADETEAAFVKIEGAVIRIGTAEAAILTEEAARISADASEASARLALTARMDTAEADIDDNAAAASTNAANITTESGVRATETGANASAIAALDARTTTAEGDILARATNARVDTVEADAAGGRRAVSRRIDELSAMTLAGFVGFLAEIEVRADETETAFVKIEGAVIRIGTAEAAILTEEAARISADASEASARLALSARMDTAEADIDDNAAAASTNAANITTESGVRASETGSNASAIAALDARTTTAEGDILARATNARVDTVEADAAGGRRAVSRRIDELSAMTLAGFVGFLAEIEVRADETETAFVKIEGAVIRIGTAEAAILTEEAARISADASEASARLALSARMDTAEADIDDNAAAVSTNAANITTESGVRASETGSNASAIAALDARTTTAEGDILARATNARVDTVEADAAASLSASEDLIYAAIGDNTSGVSVNAVALADINSRVEATYGFTLDVNDKINGMQAHSDGETATVNFAFDFFVIEGAARFTFDTGTGVLGAPGLVVDTIVANVVTANSIVNGQLGTKSSVYLDEFDFVSLASGTVNQESHFHTLTLTTDAIPVKPGSQVEVRIGYELSAEYNSYEYLRFKDTISLLVTRSDDTVVEFTPTTWRESFHIHTATSNTGSGPNVGNAYQIENQYSRDVVFVLPITGTPWVHGGTAFKKIALKLVIEAASPETSGATCVYGSIDSTKMRNSLVLQDIFAALKASINGPELNVVKATVSGSTTTTGGTDGAGAIPVIDWTAGDFVMP